MDSASYLPSNSTTLEKAVEKATHIDLDIQLEKLTLTSPQSPNQFLNALALERSVDYYDSTWSEADKRRVIKNSFDVHKRKGTLSSITRTLESLELNSTIQEWFQTNDQFGTFIITINELENTQINIFGSETVQKLDRLIQDSKRKSQHHRIILGKETEGLLNLKGITVISQIVA